MQQLITAAAVTVDSDKVLFYKQMAEICQQNVVYKKIKKDKPGKIFCEFCNKKKEALLSAKEWSFEIAGLVILDKELTGTSVWNIPVIAVLNVFACYLQCNGRFIQVALCMLTHSNIYQYNR